MRKARLGTLGIIVCLHACGGGGGSDEAPVAEPPAPTPVQLTLDAANYQGAVRNALEWSDSAFFFAKNRGHFRRALWRWSRLPVVSEHHRSLTDIE